MLHSIIVRQASKWRLLLQLILLLLLWNVYFIPQNPDIMCSMQHLNLFKAIFKRFLWCLLFFLFGDGIMWLHFCSFENFPRYDSTVGVIYTNIYFSTSTSLLWNIWKFYLMVLKEKKRNILGVSNMIWLRDSPTF